MKSLKWSEHETAAFKKSKQDLASAALLAYLALDADVYLVTDGSDSAVGMVLQQKMQDGSTQPLGFFSRLLNEGQSKWSVFGRELLAVFLAVKTSSVPQAMAR